MKKWTALFCAALLAASLAVTASAAGYGWRDEARLCYGYLWNTDGTVATESDYAARVEQAIADGLIPSDYRDYCVGLYEGWCGGGYGGGARRGGCCGCW